MATRFQQLGAFVGETEGVSDQTLDRFQRVGGRWLVVLLAQLGYPDEHDPACVRNLASIATFKQRCNARGIACGGWFNGWAGGVLGTTAAQDAEHVASIIRPYNLGPVVLDLEAAYQHPGGMPQELPKLCAEVRSRLKTRAIGVSTNSPNDSMIFNGGATGYVASLYRLGIRLLPQWYNAPAYNPSPWMHADTTMQWIRAHGMEDNWYDPQGPGKRAVPLSYVHGTLEVTGLEGASLGPEIAELEKARADAYSYGFSVYLLEAMPAEDYGLLAAQRGKLFLL